MHTEQTEYGKWLPVIARDAISDVLNAPRAKPIVDETVPWFSEPGASFVTLMQEDKLRGCIGTVTAYQPLLADIKQNAVSAAINDPRFPSLTRKELDTVSIEVSLLSAPQSLDFIDENDALAQLRPGIDGILFEHGFHRSTFLPQVWETLTQPQQFIAALKIKAGLPDNFWAEDIRLSRYTVTKWRETDLTEGY